MMDLEFDSELITSEFEVERSVSAFINDSKVAAKHQEMLSKRIAQCLPKLPDPEHALNLFHLLIRQNAERIHLEHLLESKPFTQVFMLLSYTPGMGKFLIKYPGFVTELFPVSKETPEHFQNRLLENSDDVVQDQQQKWLRVLKIKEFIRIAVSDFSGFDTFEETTKKLSIFADFCLQCVMKFCGLIHRPTAVIAMGKWGGMELNYSSDIDLLFVAGNENSLEDIYELQKSASKGIRLLDQATEDGFVFRIDNRLRPEGKTGSLIRTMDQYLDHYQKYALNWELQALVKARFAAGAKAVGTDFITMTKTLVYNSELLPETVLQNVREMKRKIESSLVAGQKQKANVKLGVGGIRDIEFIVQFLQLHHGRVDHNLRHTQTLTALERLFTYRIITKSEKESLIKEYVFLRQLEHYLQIDSELPIRQLPKNPTTLNILGRKMGFSPSKSHSTGEHLARRYTESIRNTRRLFQYFFDATINFLEKKKKVRILCHALHPSTIESHFNHLSSDYFLQFSAEEISDHIRMIEQLSDFKYCEVRVKKIDTGRWRVCIVANDFFGEFAIICGLFSAYSLTIISGESFTYAQLPNKQMRNPKSNFYPIQKRRYYGTPSENHSQVAHRRKIVCVANVKISRDSALEFPLDWDEFQTELNSFLSLLNKKNFKVASERSTLRVIRSLQKRIGSHEDLQALPPIEFNIDNDSDDVYTILEIISADRFMFLFEFANALATRNYYIGKVEIITANAKVHDRLFITSRRGNKIVSEARLNGLKATLTLIIQFSHFLPYAPNPQMALKQFSDFIDCVLDAKGKGVIPIIEQEENLINLARILGTSIFLWEDFLRMQHENLFPLLTDAKKLNSSPSASLLKQELDHLLNRQHCFADKINILNQFKDREMFRIDLRHLTKRVVHFTDFCGELTCLADVVLSEAYALAIEFIETKKGMPQPGVSTLCALGKWGSKEIGYASDIELLFLWDSEKSSHHQAVEFYEQAAQKIAQSITSKHDGVFELDFRLRPGGKHAHLATNFKHYEHYFSSKGNADAYEKQALIRLRTITGNKALRKKMEEHRIQTIFNSGDFDIDRIKELRKRQERNLVEAGEINAKFSKGGLVEAEYFIQILQILNGSQSKDLHCTNTLEAAKALHAKGILDTMTYEKFLTGYRFLRALINGLRIVRGNAKDLVIPHRDSEEFHYLVRRLENFDYPLKTSNAWEFMTTQMECVHCLFTRLKKLHPG